MEENGNILLYLTIWDEDYGSKLVDSYPKDSIVEETSDQIFQSFQTIFGNSNEIKYDRTKMVLPLKSYKMYGLSILDAVKNKKVRGGLQPFLVVLLLPDYIPDAKISEYNEIVGKIVDDFLVKHPNNGHLDIRMKDYFESIKKVTENIAWDLNKSGHKLSKQKDYKKAAQAHRIAVNLVRIVYSETFYKQFMPNYKSALYRWVQQIALEATRMTRSGEFSESIKKFKEAIITSEDKKQIKALNKSLTKTTALYAKSVEQDAIDAIKNRDYQEAHKIYMNCVDIAKLSDNIKLIKKYERLLNKIPNVGVGV